MIFCTRQSCLEQLFVYKATVFDSVPLLPETYGRLAAVSTILYTSVIRCTIVMLSTSMSSNSNIDFAEFSCICYLQLGGLCTVLSAASLTE